MLSMRFGCLVISTVLSICSGTSFAKTWEISGQYHPKSPEFSVGARDVSIPFVGDSVNWSISSRGGTVATNRMLVIPFGVASSWAQLRFLWGDGFALDSKTSAVFGPLAATLQSKMRSKFPSVHLWAYDLEDTPSSSVGITAQASYRLARQSIAHVGAGWFQASGFYMSYEHRANIEHNNEYLGTLSTQAGVQWASKVVGGTLHPMWGPTTALKFTTDAGTIYSLDGFVGFGKKELPFLASVRASAYFPTIGTTENDLKTYIAFEPWRDSYERLRIGATSQIPLEHGTLNVEGSGGFGGFRAKVGYSLPIEGAEVEETEAEK